MADAIAIALLQTGMAHASLVSTVDALQAVADKATDAFTVMSPFLNSEGLRVAINIQIATRTCPSLGQKTISMHVLRHSAAMRLLRAGIETSVIALWLGHEQVETTHIYPHADMGNKERALAATAPAVATPGRFRPNDKLLAFLEAL
jgi:integrase